MDSEKKMVSSEELEALYTAAHDFPHVAENWSKVDYDPPIRAIVYDTRKIPKEDRDHFKFLDIRGNLRMAARELKFWTWPDWKKSRRDRGGLLQSCLTVLKFTWFDLTRVETHRPDSTAYAGSVITFWQEHGDYIAAMDPHVTEVAFGELKARREAEERVMALIADAEKGRRKVSPRELREAMELVLPKSSDSE